MRESLINAFNAIDSKREAESIKNSVTSSVKTDEFPVSALKTYRSGLDAIKLTVAVLEEATDMNGMFDAVESAVQDTWTIACSKKLIGPMDYITVRDASILMSLMGSHAAHEAYVYYQDHRLSEGEDNAELPAE